MLKVDFSNKFKKQYKKMTKRGVNPKLLYSVIETLANEKPLPVKNKDHELKGEFAGHRECHILPDWLLIYYVKENVLTLTATGSHADLF